MSRITLIASANATGPVEQRIAEIKSAFGAALPTALRGRTHPNESTNSADGACAAHHAA